MPGTSIGARLIAARERSDLSLESIADKTNMPLRKLEALENDEITTDNFTAFDKAYLKKYCQFIGVVYDDLFSDFYVSGGRDGTNLNGMEPSKGDRDVVSLWRRNTRAAGGGRALNKIGKIRIRQGRTFFVSEKKNVVRFSVMLET